MKLIDNIPVWGEPIDESALSQIKTCAKTAAAVAMMADHHKGYAVPIGGVVAYYDSISPSGVGFDIACGNKAVLLDMPVAEIRANIRKIMDVSKHPGSKLCWNCNDADLLGAGLAALPAAAIYGEFGARTTWFAVSGASLACLMVGGLLIKGTDPVTPVSPPVGRHPPAPVV